MRRLAFALLCAGGAVVAVAPWDAPPWALSLAIWLSFLAGVLAGPD